MHFLKTLEEICSKWLIFCFFYSFILLLGSVSKIYFNFETKTISKIDRSFNNGSSDIYKLYTNSEIKRMFHLNIFDFDQFKIMKDGDAVKPGPCVSTRIKVRIHSNIEFLVDKQLKIFYESIIT